MRPRADGAHRSRWSDATHATPSRTQHSAFGEYTLNTTDSLFPLLPSFLVPVLDLKLPLSLSMPSYVEARIAIFHFSRSKPCQCPSALTARASPRAFLAYLLPAVMTSCYMCSHIARVLLVSPSSWQATSHSRSCAVSSLLDPHPLSFFFSHTPALQPAIESPHMSSCPETPNSNPPSPSSLILDP